MLIRRNILNNTKFTDTKICEDYFFKCEILKRCNAYCLDDYLTKYRLRNNSLQSNSLKNFYWIWKINREFNKLNVFEILRFIVKFTNWDWKHLMEVFFSYT